MDDINSLGRQRFGVHWLLDGEIDKVALSCGRRVATHTVKERSIREQGASPQDRWRRCFQRDGRIWVTETYDLPEKSGLKIALFNDRQFAASSIS